MAINLLHRFDAIAAVGFYPTAKWRAVKAVHWSYNINSSEPNVE
jgi:hypothetical protein